jgi:very-short-patch-repair endonuclease
MERHISEILPKALELARIPESIRFDESGSPIEVAFLWELKKRANEEQVSVVREQPCSTWAGLYRLDFVIKSKKTERRIAVECDGKAYHDETEDARRDRAILSTGAVDRIYRIRGKDLVHEVHQAVHLLGRLEPWLICARGWEILDSLCGPEELRPDLLDCDWHTFPHYAARCYEQPQRQEFETEEFLRKPLAATRIFWTDKADLVR